MTAMLIHGSSEYLKPEAQTAQFGRRLYTQDVPFKKGNVFFLGTRVGDVYARFECFHSPGVPWDRCQSKGTGQHGQFAQVELSIDNSPVRFSGSN